MAIRGGTTLRAVARWCRRQSGDCWNFKRFDSYPDMCTLRHSLSDLGMRISFSLLRVHTEPLGSVGQGLEETRGSQ